MWRRTLRFFVIRSIRTRREIVSALTAAASQNPTQECCGFLAGSDGVITHIFTAKNVADNPATAYEIEPKEIVGVLREIRASGLQFLGIYHSHPDGRNEPSKADIDLAYYSEEAYFIITPQPDAPNPVRAFSIRDGRSIELKIEIV
jgi:proteasome lid subunit RPN8/RPN11